MFLGLLLILVPWLIFPVCGVGRYAPAEGKIAGHHGCHKTLKAETALGIVVIGLGAVPLIYPRKKTMAAAAGLAVVAAFLAALFPTVITGMCKVPTMPCNLGTTPALVTVGAMLGLAGGAGFWAMRKLP